MNSPALRWLLGIDALPSGTSGVGLVFERPLPGWAWFLLLCACGGAAWWSYARLRGSPRGRAVLGTVRALLLLLIAVLVAGPALRAAQETVEEDWVLVLADRSRSMTIRDAGTDAARERRDDELRATLAESSDAWRIIDRERQLVWLGFAGGAFDLAPRAQATPNTSSGGAGEPPVELGEPTGERTRLDDALSQALQRAAARPIAGIVIFSDGRTSAPPSRATVRRLQAAAARVFVVPLGSEEPRGDLALAKAEAPRRAFVRDEVPVHVTVERPTADVPVPAATVRLVDTATGETVARADVPAFAEGETEHEVTLVAKPETSGARDWRVELDAGPADLVAENNMRQVRVELVDRPLRILYVDGYPRWEYRYLKNLLIREASIDSSILLLSADRDFAQEGNMPLARLPRNAEEFAPFDLVIIGDVPAGFFTPEQLEAIRDQVAQKGTGLLWIGGERATPKSWEGTALAELLPMRPPLALPASDASLNMVATPAAAQLGLLKLGEGDRWPLELADPSVGWSRLEWAQAIPQEQLKPTAETLAVGIPAGEPSRGDPARTLPLVIAMKYGAGEIIYVATDEIWRWRYGRGERYTEQVWLPLVRMLGREALAGGGEAATLRAIPARVQLGQSVRLELVINDARLAERGENAASARVTRTGSGPAGAATEIELVRGARAGELAASVTPEEVGQHLVHITSGVAAGAEITFECERPDEETRRAAADHQVLKQLAEDTGGAVLSRADLARLPEVLPNRRVTSEQATIEPLWDSPLALILLILLATIEWLGRRWMRLA